MNLTSAELHQWIGWIKRQRHEIYAWVSMMNRTNLLIGSKAAWLKAYALARGRYQRETLMGFRRWDGAGGKEHHFVKGKKLDLRHLRKKSLHAFAERLIAAKLTKTSDVFGRQMALGCARIPPTVPSGLYVPIDPGVSDLQEVSLTRVIDLLEKERTVERLGWAIGVVMKFRAEAAIDRSVRIVPEPAWILDGEKIHHERRNAQKREDRKSVV